MSEYTVIGCGVSGLLTVFFLLEKGVEAKSIHVIAEHFPGDLSVRYASPAAGAYFAPCSDPIKKKYSDYTYQNIDKVIKFLSGYKRTGVSFCKSTELALENLTKEELEYIGKGIDNYKTLTPSELSQYGVVATSGYTYKTIQWNSPVFISNLYQEFQKLGVKFTKAKVNSIKEISTEIIFNCSGVGSGTLEGVEDPQVEPVRGQVLVVLAPHIKEVTAYWGENESTYIIPRIGTDLNEVILGGYYQDGNDLTDALGSEVESILQRTTKMYPKLLLENPRGPNLKDLPILRVVVGHRPGRKGGVRVEKEFKDGKTIIHNYGACGEGYILGLGLAFEAVSLLNKESRL